MTHLELYLKKPYLKRWASALESIDLHDEQLVRKTIVDYEKIVDKVYNLQPALIVLKQAEMAYFSPLALELQNKIKEIENNARTN